MSKFFSSSICIARNSKTLLSHLFHSSYSLP